MRLLSRTIRYYFFYSFIVLLIAVPLFYFIIRQIVTDDVDKDLFTQKEIIVRKLDKAVVFDLFDLLENFGPDVDLFRSPTVRLYDTLYTVRLYNRLTREVVPYRVLSSNVIIRGEPYVIQLKSSLVNNEDLIRSIVLVQALLLVLIGAGLVLINRNLTRQIWNPFYQTLQKLRTYKIEQEESIRLERSEIDEFNDLNQTIEDLAQRNRQVYQSQKEFTENAAHEMQTPLAVLQSKLELLMQTEPLTGEQAALIATLAETNSRLSRLNKSLLLLTKIENNQYPETEELNVAEVCRKVIAQVSDEADVQGIKIETNFEESVKVTANRTLFEILVSNLLSNAIRYNHTDGIVKVTCNHQQLRVQNTGSDIKLDAEKIFDRFHKEGIHSQSIGLGLAIVKRIAALYHFTI
ncbi:MAG: HAMP domain-containing histidine kinase, partial [Flavisolibacter sp.]|nr:HAMP domain-containing histidine kinase [Flavisolibacter sp.]